MTTETPEPRTEAGRRTLGDWYLNVGDKQRFADDILAIEAEAARLALEGVAERVRASHDDVCLCPFDGTDPDCNLVVSAELLSALLSPAETPPAGEDGTPPVPAQEDMETCPTCWQPVPVPQRGDHDYGIPLSALPPPDERQAGLREALEAVVEAGRVTTQEVMNSEHGAMVCIPRTVLLDARRALSVAPVPAQEDMETCPTCWQPVPVPQRGDHDYGLGLRAQDEGGAVNDQ